MHQCESVVDRHRRKKQQKNGTKTNGSSTSVGQNRAYSGSFKATYDLVIAFHFHSAESNPICRQSRQQGLRTVLELPQHCRQRIRTNIRLNGIGLKEKVQVQKVSVSRNNIIHFLLPTHFFCKPFFFIFCIARYSPCRTISFC